MDVAAESPHPLPGRRLTCSRDALPDQRGHITKEIDSIFRIVLFASIIYRINNKLLARCSGLGTSPPASELRRSANIMSCETLIREACR